MTVFGDRAYEEVIKLNEVVRLGLIQSDLCLCKRKFGYRHQERKYTEERPHEDSGKGAICKLMRDASGKNKQRKKTNEKPANTLILDYRIVRKLISVFKAPNQP